jgi:hypothetical protein
MNIMSYIEALWDDYTKFAIGFLIGYMTCMLIIVLSFIIFMVKYGM